MPQPGYSFQGAYLLGVLAGFEKQAGILSTGLRAYSRIKSFIRPDPGKIVGSLTGDQVSDALGKLNESQITGLLDRIPKDYISKMVDRYLSNPKNIDHLIDKYGPQLWEAGKKRFMGGNAGGMFGSIGGALGSAGDAANWWLNQTKGFGKFMGGTLFGEENYDKLFGGAPTNGASTGGQSSSSSGVPTVPGGSH